MIKHDYGDISFSIDTDKELFCLIDYIQKTWTNLPCDEDLYSFVKEIFIIGLEDSKNHIDFFDDLNFDKKREDYLQSINKESLIDFDHVYQFLNFAPLVFHRLGNQLKKISHVDDRPLELIKTIKEKYNILDDLQPIGWDLMESSYIGFDGMEEFDHKTNDQLFLGHHNYKAAGYEFHVRIALPYIMYDEKEQDRSRLYILIHSIYSHAKFCAELNNNHELLIDYKQFVEEIIYSDVSFSCFPLSNSNRFLEIIFNNYSKDLKINESEFNRKFQKTIE